MFAATITRTVTGAVRPRHLPRGSSSISRQTAQLRGSCSCPSEKSLRLNLRRRGAQRSLFKVRRKAGRADTLSPSLLTYRIRHLRRNWRRLLHVRLIKKPLQILISSLTVSPSPFEAFVCTALRTLFRCLVLHAAAARMGTTTLSISFRIKRKRKRPTMPTCPAREILSTPLCSRRFAITRAPPPPPSTSASEDDSLLPSIVRLSSVRHATFQALLLSSIASHRVLCGKREGAGGEPVEGVDADPLDGKAAGATENDSGATGEAATAAATVDYLCNDLDLIASEEPCLMCAMACVHSRVRRAVFLVGSQTRAENDVKQRCWHCRHVSIGRAEAANG